MELFGEIFGELPAGNAVPKPIKNSDDTESSITISNTSSITISNTSSFLTQQQSIINETFKHISLFSCGQELNKDRIVKDKLQLVITTLYNAIIGGDEFLRKYDLSKKNKAKWGGDSGSSNNSPNTFKFLSLKDARHIASSIMGCDVNKWNREEERRLCIELSLVKLYSYHPEGKQLFISSFDDLLQSYPEFEAIQYESEEMEKLLNFRNFMKIACCTMQAHNNKGHLLDIVTRLCEGTPEVIKYITGSGERPTTRRRVLIYEREGDVSKISRPERAILRKEEKQSKFMNVKSNSKRDVSHSHRINTKSLTHRFNTEVQNFKHHLSLRNPSKMSQPLDDDTPRSGFEILVDIVAQESMVLIESIAKEQIDAPPTPSINDINPPDFKHTFGCSGETFGQNLPPPSLLRLTSLGIIEKDFQSQENLLKNLPIEKIEKGLPMSDNNIPFTTDFYNTESFSPRFSGEVFAHQTGLQITP